MSPFFIALNLNQFELARSLVPKKSAFAKKITSCEYAMLIEKLKTGINPLLLNSIDSKAKLE
jgi:hypothetical protein